MARTLLVVDDDEASCRLMRATFRAEGFEVLTAYDGAAGLERALRDRPDVMLLDLRLPELDGLTVLERLKAEAPRIAVVMLTAEREVKTAVRATQLGAFDYLTKPIDTDEIVLVVRRALEDRALHMEVEDLRRRLTHDETDLLVRQMGPSSHVSQIAQQVGEVAASTFTVLILGETGTGKELVAQAIHRVSERRRKPFVALDCGAIPETLLESELFGYERGAFTGAERRRTGRFQLAEGGSVFLDEIGNMPLSLQGKLLRVLESRQVQPVGSERATSVDVRFIAATNDQLQSHVDAGQFRSDLYFRLAQYTIHVPSLRQRPEDIPHLAQRFLEEASLELRRPVQQLVPAAMELLQRHDWPGNVRELRNVVRQAVLRSTELVLRPADIRVSLGSMRTGVTAAARGPANRSLREIADDASRAAERQAIADTLRSTGGNVSKAARALRTDYKTLHVKLKRLGIRARDFGR